jgi:hypothetical protein
VTPVNVLVVFYSRYGETERLALAAGLGAIQAEGSIRLRRVADLAARERIDADRLTRARLHGQRLVHLARALKDAGVRDMSDASDVASAPATRP